MLATQLKHYLAEAGIAATEAQQQQLLAFVALLDKWNKAYNLTSVRDPQQMLIRHIMDSLAVSPYLQGKRFIDVGTGPGLPGIPLAIMHPDKQFVLLDSLGKRIRFQRQVQIELKLGNIFSVESRVEDYQPQELFDGVLSRAFASVSDMLNWCAHLPQKNGAFYALKGQLDAAELAEIPSRYTVQQQIQLTVPHLDEQRHLLIITSRD
ncbi:16S rRNA (guanine(527)-N(7))-methyltransferase RsmG [Shewanella yunxiaonensis]|uniref:Ribosomal RNA small subunit methyltransferase G n=1 Tax=Shewanella yunxiaonensis TaxID=2829809 RepID=A0ABX7YSY3_9GAMM|nr:MULTISPECIES: 16S rRNA (guanine(527)-N(7))-methyltransferase RsmG [Shewanella]MDF0535339.1 16S rRNA (guanine(527)-N(7))-methyltransferase RsmG [Shewanella sp. A32]QUN05913.1 16S rRNA (guanine(527)-N(7))-methyltransferase RsmG [Shewanella yunxiaonensis]